MNLLRGLILVNWVFIISKYANNGEFNNDKHYILFINILCIDKSIRLINYFSYNIFENVKLLT